MSSLHSNQSTAPSKTLPVVFFPPAEQGQKETVPCRVEHYDWDVLCAVLRGFARQNVGVPKGTAGYFILCELKPGTDETLPPWLEGDLRAEAERLGYRSDEHVIVVHGLGVDHDLDPSKAPDLDPAAWPCKTLLYGSASYDATTAPGKLRALLAPFSRPVSLDEYRRLRVVLQRKIPGGVIASRSATQPVYLPTTPLGRETPFWLIDGADTLDVDALLAEAPELAPVERARIPPGEPAPGLDDVEGWAARLAAGFAPDGQKEAAIFALAGMCARECIDEDWTRLLVEGVLRRVPNVRDMAHGIGQVAKAYGAADNGRGPGLAAWLATGADDQTGRDFYLALLGSSRSEVDGIRHALTELCAHTANDNGAERAQIERARMALEDGISQLTVAEAFVAYDDCFRWADDQRHWLVFDGSRYVKRGDAAIMDRFNALGRALNQKPRGEGDLFYGAEANGVIKRAKSLVALQSGDFDQNTDELVFRDVRLNLRTGATAPNGPDSLVTKALPWKYEPATSESRRALQYFLDSFELDPDVWPWLRRVFGCAIAGRINREKLFLNMFGVPDAGKSTLVEMIHRSLGCYFATPSSKLLMTRAKDAGGHTDDLMSVPGARIWWSDETQRGDRLNAQLIKSMTNGTGAATVRLSGKGTPGRDVPVTWLVALTTNWIVKIDVEDVAVLNRQKIVKFERTFPKDPTFINRTHPAIHPALIEWLALGARESLDGLGPDPAAVVKAGEENATEQDWLGQILDELFESDPKGAGLDYAVIQQAVIVALKNRGQGHLKVTPQALGRTLTAKGYEIDGDRKPARRKGIRRIAGT